MTGDYGTRSSAQMAWLVLAFGLVATLLTAGGWLAFAEVRSGATGPPAAPTATLAEPPDEVAFGAPSLADGVPRGFALDADGAASAVTAVAVTGQRDTVFDPGRFRRVAAVVFTPQEAAEQARQVEAARVQFESSSWTAQPDSRRTYHFAPLAVRLERFDPAALTATAQVWAMTLVGVGDTGGGLFTTSTVELAAPDGTWRVTALDTVEGPTPIVDAAPSPPGAVRKWLRDAAATLPLPLGPDR